MVKFLIILIVLLPFIFIGLWHLVYAVRRNHRLKNQEDERRQKKLIAEDFAQLLQDTARLDISFTDYFEAGRPKQRVENRVE